MTDARQRAPTIGSSAHRTGIERIPALNAAAALGAGIALDRAFEPSAAVWMLLGLTTACVAWRTAVPRFAAVATLLLLCCGGGLRHHLVWTTRATDDIASFSIVDGAPVRLIGVVATHPEIIPPRRSVGRPPDLQSDRTVCEVQCEALVANDTLQSVSGLIRLDISGHLLRIVAGDRIAFTGTLRIPQAPRSPEDFDFRNWLRSRGIDRVIQLEHPDSITWLEHPGGASAWWTNTRARFRQYSADILLTHLSPDIYPVGASLLLGTRTGLSEELRDAFIHSGTMHLLAISGLHVAILASFVWGTCRGLNVSSGWSIATVLTVLLGYAVLTDLRPPVLRAVVLGLLMAAAVPGARLRSGFNLLAVTGFLLLLWNPCDLFDVGAQLSFLAVAAILWSARVVPLLPWPQGDVLLDEDRPRWRRTFDGLLRRVIECYVVTAAIWLFTLPVTLAWFHLISPVGFLINVILLPFSYPLLICGFLTLACGLTVAPLAAIPAAGYDACLRVLLWLVESSGNLSWSHWSAGGPSALWMALFYSALAVAVFARETAARRWAWRGIAAGVALSLVWSLRPVPREGLTCTFIDVGHGGAVLIEFPRGRTLLYDAGAFGQESRAEIAIAAVLAQKRIWQIDALVISHADLDHFNAASGLIDMTPAGGVYFSHAFLDETQAGVFELCEAASARSIPLRLLQAGDWLQVDDDADVRVLHPRASFANPLDNANSIVLEIHFAGRRILLTGDLERAGLTELLSTVPAGRVDVLQSPHHGSKVANTSELDRWSTPRIVIASSRDPEVDARLAGVYVNAEQVLSTASFGTVTIRISPAGEISLQHP